MSAAACCPTAIWFLWANPCTLWSRRCTEIASEYHIMWLAENKKKKKKVFSSSLDVIENYKRDWFFFSMLPVGHFFLISLIAGSLSIKDGRSMGLIQRVAGRQSTIDSAAGADPYLPQVFGSLFSIRSSAVDMVFNPVNLLLLSLDAKELWVRRPAGKQQWANTHHFNACNQGPTAAFICHTL